VKLSPWPFLVSICISITTVSHSQLTYLWSHTENEPITYVANTATVMLYLSTKFMTGFVHTVEYCFSGLFSSCKDQIPGFSMTSKTRFKGLPRIYSVHNMAAWGPKSVHTKSVYNSVSEIQNDPRGDKLHTMFYNKFLQLVILEPEITCNISRTTILEFHDFSRTNAFSRAF